MRQPDSPAPEGVIVAQLEIKKHPDQQHEGNSECQTGEVDHRKKLSASQVAQHDFEMVFEHVTAENERL
jgi:hypothetical protein